MVVWTAMRSWIIGGSRRRWIEKPTATQGMTAMSGTVAERFVQAYELTRGKPCGVWCVMDIPIDEAHPAETPTADTNVIVRMGDEYEVNATDECEKAIYIALDSGSAPT